MAGGPRAGEGPPRRSWRVKALSSYLRATIKRRLRRLRLETAALAAERAHLDAFAPGEARRYPDVAIEACVLGGVPCESLTPPDPGGAVIVYVHGGAFVMGSPRSHRILTLRLARQSRDRLLAVDYRLAPEHPCPAALEDIASVWEALLADGVAPGRAVFAGDSAGGNLVLAAQQLLRERGLPRPAGVACLSPWTDLAGSGASLAANARRDPFLPAERLGDAARVYAGGRPLPDPLVSPLYADYRGSAPLLLHVGTEEILLDDSLRVHERATAAGVDASLRVWPGMPHVFQAFGRFIPEGRDALEDVAAFVDRVTGTGASAGTAQP